MINRLEQFFAAIASSGIGRILGYSFLLILPALVLAKDQIQISSTTMEILENHFKHQDLLHIHSACIERINCKNYFERNTEYRQIETKESPQLSLERYGAIGLTSGSIVKGYALYFSDVLDGYIESPIVIDVEIDSNDRNSVKKVLTLIENSYEEISTDYGEYVYLFGEQYRMDGMSLEVFVVETVTEQKDYSIRYLFHYGGPRKGPSYEDNDPLTEYFAKALNVFLISDEEAVRAALLAAAVVARPKQREHMKALLVNAIEVLNADKRESFAVPIRNLKRLIREVSKKVTFEESSDKLSKLYRLDKGFAEALANGDPTIFNRRYPSLFLR